MLLQSGSAVPEWILKLPKPSKMKRREMGKVKRADAVNNARRVGRGDAIKKRQVVRCTLSGRSMSSRPRPRDMIAGSKRRKAKGAQRKETDPSSAPSQVEDGTNGQA